MQKKQQQELSNGQNFMATILQSLPKEAVVTKINFEGPRIALYTKTPKYLIENNDIIANLVNVIKKRIVIRTDESIRKILVKAIEHGGSTIRDYVSSDGVRGNFQSNFLVYNKEGKKISKFTVKKVIQNGRSTYYCPELQKEQNKN